MDIIAFRYNMDNEAPIAGFIMGDGGSGISKYQ